MGDILLGSSRTFYSLGSVSADDGQSHQQVIIEWTSSRDSRLNEDLIRKFEAIRLLSSAEDSATFGFLNFMGFCINHKGDYGCILAQPSSPTLLNQDDVGPMTLASVLANESKRSSWEHLLQEKFALALALVRSVHHMHQSGLYHERISTSTIIFFPSSLLSTKFFARPYIIGFSLVETYGDPELKYLHPQFLQNESRFKPIYDFYSLGMVLLEIGLWKRIEEPPWDSKQFRNVLLTKYVPLLGHTMGDNYRHAVETCLRAEWEGSYLDDGFTDDNIKRMLKRKVVDVLANINI